MKEQRKTSGTKGPWQRHECESFQLSSWWDSASVVCALYCNNRLWLRVEGTTLDPHTREGGIFSVTPMWVWTNKRKCLNTIISSRVLQSSSEKNKSLLLFLSSFRSSPVLPWVLIQHRWCISLFLCLRLQDNSLYDKLKPRWPMVTSWE